MAEYIKREDALKEVDRSLSLNEAYSRIASRIIAADVVEVPCHCKDCRYNDPSWQLSANSIGCRYWGIYPDPDDWCCKAERKGGAT